MQDPTPERVRELIHSIIRSKIEDGQLDESPLTLREITQIEDQFVKILSGVLHRRIEYPATKHLTDAPEVSEAPDEGPEAPDAAPEE
jgi:membrane-associated HD superfamily phosphohydrolase